MPSLLALPANIKWERQKYHGMEILTLLTFLLTLVFIAAGYAIAFRRDLLARCFSRGDISDSRGLRLWIGLNIVVLGMLAGVSALLQYFYPSTHLYMFLAFAAVILPLMAFRICRGSRRYMNVYGAAESSPEG